MSPEQAKHLAHLIIDTWPAHVVKAFIWCEALTELRYETALGVYEHLRDNDDRAPTIARFLQVYRSVTPSYGWDTPTDTGPAISLSDYLANHRDNNLQRTRDQHPSSR